MSSLDSYFIIGDSKREHAETIHDSMVFLRDNIFSHDELGDWYFDSVSIHGSYNKPHSFFDIMQPGVPVPRNLALINSMITDQLVSLATKPELIGFQITKPDIYVSDDEPEITSIDAVTASGYDAQSIEQLQRQWWEHSKNSDITTQILEYNKALTNSFADFNLQSILSNIGKMYMSTSRYNVPSGAQPVQDMIDMSFDDIRATVPTLENAYYNSAKRELTRAGQLNIVISEHEFGRLFALTSDESVEYIIEKTRLMYEE